MFNDPKVIELLEEIRASSRETEQTLRHISSQLTWMNFVLAPILLANLFAAIMLFVLD